MENARDVPEGEVRVGELAAPAPSLVRADLRTRARQLLHAQRERASRVEQALTFQLQTLWEHIEQERAAAEQRQAGLAAERDRLQAQLEEAEQQLLKVDFTVRGAENAEDLQRQLEMALQELRELKAANAGLVQQLSTARSAAPPSGSLSDQGFDWESQKRRLLQQLESDFQSPDPQRSQERLTIEKAIRATDRAMAEKDREIAELQAEFKRRLAGLGNAPRSDSAASVAELLDQDEIIRQERENLRRIQEEWRERIRQAEVEASVERAKIARERVVLEDRIRALEAERAEFMAIRGEDNAADKAKSRPRGRWLARLGLKEDDEEEGNKTAEKR